MYVHLYICMLQGHLYDSIFFLLCHNWLSCMFICAYIILFIKLYCCLLVWLVNNFHDIAVLLPFSKISSLFPSILYHRLTQDTAWHPVWKKEFDSSPALRKAIIFGYGPLRPWMSIAHWCVTKYKK
jgi:hypothetical protein